jgi:magnesium transporter
MATNLLSVAGLVGSPIITAGRTGRITDIVVRHDTSDTYPRMTGLVVRTGRSLTFVRAADIAGLSTGRRPVLRCDRDPAPFQRRDDDVLLAADVLDREVIDADGVRVIRAADLYLAVISGTIRLIALDTSIRTLLRRLGPRRLRARTRPAAGWVIDWSHIDAFAPEPQALHLSTPRNSLRRTPVGDLVSTLGLTPSAGAAVDAVAFAAGTRA